MNGEKTLRHFSNFTNFSAGYCLWLPLAVLSLVTLAIFIIHVFSILILSRGCGRPQVGWILTVGDF